MKALIRKWDINYLYWNDTSEYLLNNNLCRLKDIQDLFMDTGMGSDAYSVIELKMIEQILSTNNDDRRILLEEAAGISGIVLARRPRPRRGLCATRGLGQRRQHGPRSVCHLPNYGSAS